MYLCLLLYVSVIYIRPAEFLASGAGIPFLEILSLLVLPVVVLAYLRDPRPWAPIPHDGFLLGFWLAIVASNLTSGWFGGALKGLFEFFRIVFYYFLMRAAVREPRHLRGLMALVVGLTLVQAASGIVQYYTGVGAGGVEILPSGRIRGTGIFNDPNDLAQALLLVIPFLLVAVAASGVRPGYRALGLLALPPILLALLFASSRGAALGFAAVAVAFAVWRVGRAAGVAVAVAAVIVVVVSGPRQVLDGLETGDSGEFFAQTIADATAEEAVTWRDASTAERIEAWSEGLTLLRTRPIFGVGYSRFLEFNRSVAHNSFVHTFAELGLVGAFFGTGLVYWFFKGLWLCRGGAPRRTAALALSGLALVVTTSFLSRQYDFVLHTLLGMGACHFAVTTGPDHRQITTGRDLGIIAMLTVAGVVATKLAVTVLTAWTRG